MLRANGHCLLGTVVILLSLVLCLGARQLMLPRDR